jgi:hypothetical protein
MTVNAMLRSSCFVLILALAQGCTPPADGTPASPSAADRTANTPAAPANGPQVIHTKDGGRMEGDMTNGMRTGLWTSYFPDGSVRSRVTYRNGKEEGPTEVFHANGMPYYAGTYHQGLTVGEWVFFDPTGKEVKRVTYDSTGVAQR